MENINVLSPEEIKDLIRVGRDEMEVTTKIEAGNKGEFVQFFWVDYTGILSGSSLRRVEEAGLEVVIISPLKKEKMRLVLLKSLKPEKEILV